MKRSLLAKVLFAPSKEIRDPAQRAQAQLWSSLMFIWVVGEISFALIVTHTPKVLNFGEAYDTHTQLAFEWFALLSSYFLSRTRFYKASIWFFILINTPVLLRPILLDPQAEVIAGYLVYFNAMLLTIGLVMTFRNLVFVAVFMLTGILISRLRVPPEGLPFYNNQFIPLIYSALLVTIGTWIRERTTQQLEAERARNIHLARLSSLGEMAGGVAHEINNPLAIIMGLTDQIRLLLHQENYSKELLQKDLDRIDSSVDRVARIVKGLLSFSREESGGPSQVVGLQSIVNDVLNLYGEQLRYHGVTLTVSPLEGIQLRCVAVQIVQILLNLLSNSLDAISPVPEKWIRIEVKRTGSTALISVIDSGPKIPPKLEDKIMQPFFTTKEPGKGTGLGLSISRGLAEKNGGSLVYNSQSPHTRFDLRLPLACD